MRCHHSDLFPCREIVMPGLEIYMRVSCGGSVDAPNIKGLSECYDGFKQTFLKLITKCAYLHAGFYSEAGRMKSDRLRRFHTSDFILPISNVVSTR